jgi:hypothetical protein
MKKVTVSGDMDWRELVQEELTDAVKCANIYSSNIIA